jgi:hypothetical protein
VIDMRYDSEGLCWINVTSHNNRSIWLLNSWYQAMWNSHGRWKSALET